MSISSEVIGIARSGRHRLKVRKAAKQFARTAGAKPAGQYDVFVYFADTDANLYQLRQWFNVLKAVDVDHRVLILCRSADAALALRKDPTNPFPIVVAAQHNAIDPYVAAHDPKLAFYVNHHRANFAMLWHPSLLHVYIGHGDSDKLGISASNQLKAYDFTYVAGQAAIDRIKRRLINFDIAERLVEVGRPQIDIEYSQASTHEGRRTVLYAPSWEGDRKPNAYGSVTTHGAEIIKGLLADASYRVVFRPHPLSGKRVPRYRQDVDQLAGLIENAAKANPAAGHAVDTSADFGHSLAAADVVIADVSAVALDAIAANKPVVVTEPKEPLALVSPRSVMARFPLLPASQAASIINWINDAESGDAAKAIREVREYCFGDTSPGASTGRFVSQTSKLTALRDELLTELPAD